MSCYSGKSDLFDLISGLAGWKTKEGKSLLDEESAGSLYSAYKGPLYSNEWEDFLVFKQKTKGVIHQHKKVLVSEYNQEEVKKHCSQFNFTEHTRAIKDNRFTNNIREEKYFTYTYWNKEYSSLKELNKHGVYITIDIHFDTLLDLIPYYPHIVTAGSCANDSMFVVISDKPYPIERRDESLKNGGIMFDNWSHYSKKLQDHYREIVLKHYNPEGREVVEELEFKLEKDENNLKEEGGFEFYYIAKTSHNIDDQFVVEWVFDEEVKPHWSSPEIVGKNHIKMSRHDAQDFLGTTMKVKYVRKD